MRPLLLAALALVCGCATAREKPGAQLAAVQSAEALELARLEDARELGEGRIEALTRAPAPANRSRALLALARIQAPETTGVVATALDDPEPQVRAMAAFALGQVGLAWAPIPEPTRELAERRLLERLAREDDPEVRDALAEALGKVGGPKGLKVLVEAGTARAALALAVLAKSSDGRLKDAMALRLFEKLLSSKEEGDRFAGAYGLMRYQDPSARSALARCLGDSSFAVRASCGRALGSLGTPSDVRNVSALLEDRDERVAAEVARTLAKLLNACQTDDCPALEALAASKAPWRPAVASAISAEPVTTSRALALFAVQYEALGRALQAGPADTLAWGTLARTQCEVALSHDRIVGRMALLSTCGPVSATDQNRGVKAARALSESQVEPEIRLSGLLSLAQSPEARVRAATAAGLAALGGARAKKAIVEMLGDDDWLVAAAAAAAVEAGRIAEAGRALLTLLERAQGEGASEAAQAALSAATALELQAVLPVARRLVLQGSPHVRQAAARAVAALTGEMPRATPPPWEQGPHASEPLRDPLFVQLQTERGPVRILLHPDESPLTVANFVSLVRKGFYKGLAFHRVVPNFVAQGGDPTGTGSGGPGYTIRCEVNPLRFRTGSVGMALSGKDTGGSQFFISLAPHPHLDGRYTLFGEVVEGMEAVRALAEGDRILDTVIEPPPDTADLGTLRQQQE